MEFEIICLANSRKRSARCIAGLHTDGQGWLRPVGWTTDGGLTENNYWLDNGTEPQVLDVIKLRCSRPHPKPYHPEDWIIAAHPWALEARPAGAEHLELLRQALSAGPALLGDTAHRVLAAQFKTQPAASSLALVEPENLQWVVQDFNGKRRFLANFSLRGASYSLAVTDPVYEEKLALLPSGTYPRSAAEIPDAATVWMTVSLSEPFNKNEPGAETFCYKLAAAVIVLPESEPPARRPLLQAVHERNYEKWSASEDERLIVMVKSGMTAEAIARLLQRSESAVLRRVGKLALDKYRDLL